MDRIEFLKKYNIDKDDFQNTGLDWDELLKIYEDYKKLKPKLEAPAELVFKNLMKADKVHSVRYRIKNEEHVIEKIIRKRIEEPKNIINSSNYKTKLTDLIGLRALHLFKEDWIVINEHLKNDWILKGKPIAYYRLGDDNIKQFRETNCIAKKHRFAYRSVHYLIEINFGRQSFIGEVQVRTIFEEAWSEIDHKIRYPYYIGDAMLSQYLLILNRLAGSADEMGTFIKTFHTKLVDWKNEIKQIIPETKTKRENKVFDELSEMLTSSELTDEIRKYIISSYYNKNGNF